eukprot:TRINITY_DN3306_c0_g1_i3.p1 TRINITY_DN3306_c0_g1~~TRINITY_DN3306_c0_g1_i3.p1  ORF type:complete len:421 (+),score=85.91 TRINITY_DN3306_c0_g1_i3:169-1263(+)
MAAAKVAAALLGTAAGMKCPGSKAFPHASCEVTVTAAASCATVAAEIKARASGVDGWKDPHNGGIYSVLSSSATEIETQRTTNPAKSVGGQVYTDKQIFTLTEENGGCKIEGCSESQGVSVKDFSTNYCDLRNLYCDAADGCKSVSEDFAVTEGEVKPSLFAGKDKSVCIATQTAVELTGLASTDVSATSGAKCPGSQAWPHASCEITATAAASCATVAAEIKARASGAGGWTDPHNGGIYSVLSSSATEIATQRTTNPAKAVGGKVYTDKQIFTLTEENGTCKIQGCSESQGVSVKDFSTNYCDLRNLFCDEKDGCKAVTTDFAVTESEVKPSLFAGEDKSVCIVKTTMGSEEDSAAAGLVTV